MLECLYDIPSICLVETHTSIVFSVLQELSTKILNLVRKLCCHVTDFVVFFVLFRMFSFVLIVAQVQVSVCYMYWKCLLFYIILKADRLESLQLLYILEFYRNI